jgi:acyl carrier protein
MDKDLETRVKAFVARERATNFDDLNLDSTLFGDLGTDGADGWELIEDFGKEFDVDLSGFDPAKHFGPECGADLGTLIVWFVEEVLRRRDPHEVWGLNPITIRDLVKSAEKKQWIK